MVRTIQVHELTALRELGRTFYAEAKLPGRFRYAVFAETWRRILGAGMGTILGWWPEGLPEPLGALGAMLHPDPNDGDLVAAEAFWMMAPAARGGNGGMRLFRAFEEWGARAGARRLVMVHLANGRAGKLSQLYQRLGYREIETHYLKEINLKGA